MADPILTRLWTRYYVRQSICRMTLTTRSLKRVQEAATDLLTYREAQRAYQLSDEADIAAFHDVSPRR